MSREEYIRQLDYLLQDIPDNEREEAVAFYTNYFEDAGEGEEEHVIETLGSPEKVAAMIKDGLGENEEGAGEYTESGYQDARYREDNRVPDIRSGNSWEEQPRHTGKRFGTTEIVLIVIGCLIGIPLVIPVFGAVIGTFGVAVGILVGGFAVTFAALISGMVLVGVGIAQMFVSPPIGCLMLGVGFMTLAFGSLAMLVSVYVIGKFLPWLVRSITNLIGRILHRGGKRP